MNKLISWRNIDNEPLSAITHFIGMMLSIAGLILMVVFAARQAPPAAPQVVGFSIFGATLILLYAISGLYHSFAKGSKIKLVFQKADHMLIYALIAGTYTPLCLTLNNRAWGWTMFGIIWGLAALGIILKISKPNLPYWVTTIIYLVMGWLVVIAIKPLTAWLPTKAFWWLLGGGICYTVGVIFFALDPKVKKHRWFSMHDIFHIFVLGGSFCHFWLMLHYVVAL